MASVQRRCIQPPSAPPALLRLPPWLPRCSVDGRRGISSDRKSASASARLCEWRVRAARPATPRAASDGRMADRKWKGRRAPEELGFCLHYICTQVWALSIVGYWALLHTYARISTGNGDGGMHTRPTPVKPDGDEFLPI
jgi:hypothetical protein